MIGEVGGRDLEAGDAQLVEHVDRFIVEGRREAEKTELRRESPKSTSITRPPRVIITFEGLRSRCTTRF